MTSKPQATHPRPLWRRWAGAALDLVTGPREANPDWDVRTRHPRFAEAVLADARVTAAFRAEPFEFRSRADAIRAALRLCVVTDSFFAMCCYRAKARCQTHQIPVLPALLNRLAIMTGDVSIGDPVLIRPGIYVPHGHVVIDGITEIESGVVVSPFVSIGLLAGEMRGPIIGRRARIGTGARVLGPLVIGDEAVVGANAVVVRDVAAKTTVVGVPARPVGHTSTG